MRGGQPAAWAAAYRPPPLIAAATLTTSLAVAATGQAGHQLHARLVRAMAGTVLVAEPRGHEGLAWRLDGARRVDWCR